MLLICMFNQGLIVQKKSISSVQGFVHTEVTQPLFHNIYLSILIIFFYSLTVRLGFFRKKNALLKM